MNKSGVLILFIIYFQLRAFGNTQNQTHLNCISSRVVQLVRDDSSPFGPIDFMISDRGATLTHNVSPSERLIYNNSTNQFKWETGNNNSYLIRFDSQGFFYNEGTVPTDDKNGRVRMPDRMSLPTPIRKAIEDVLLIGKKEVSSKVKECLNILTFKEQLKLPLAPLEIETCRSKLEDIKKLQSCFENKNCPSIYKEVMSQGNSQYSFVSLFESDITMTDPQRRIGVVMAADTTGSWSANALLVANRVKIAKTAARVGMKFTTVFALFNTISLFSKPLWLAIFDYDKCGDNGFFENQGQSMDDCLGKGSQELQNIFSSEILKAIENPNHFFNTVGKSEDGRMARLACYAFESVYNQWRTSFSGFGTPTCQGRTVSFQNGTHYIIAEDSHLIRNENIDQAYHFYENSDATLENRNTGKRLPIISINDPKAKTRERVSQTPDHAVVPQRILEEQTILQAIYPELKSLIQNGQCRPQQESSTGQSTN